MNRGVNSRKTDPFLTAAVLLILAFCAVFIVYPVWKALELSLTKNGQWSLESYRYVFQKTWLLQSFWNSIVLGAVTATVSVVIGYLFAYLIGRTHTKYKKFFRLMATLPIISPPFMLTLSLILLLGNNGLFTKLLPSSLGFTIYGLWGIVFAQTICMFPIAYLTLVGVLNGINSSLEDAALDLGASKLRSFWDVTFKLSAPGIISAWLLVFVTSLADFANPMILSGKFDVLSVQAYLQFTGMGNLELGAALSILLLVPALAAYFLQKYYLKSRSFVTVTGKPQRFGSERVTPGARRFLEFLGLSFSALVILLYVTVLAGCFTKAWGIDYSFSLENFNYIFHVGWKTIQDTVYLSAITTPIAGLLGLFIAYLVLRTSAFGRQWLDTLCMIPYALPGTIAGIGFVLAFNTPPLALTGTATLIVLSFLTRHMPVGIEAAKASLIQIDPSIDEAATDLGAGPFRVFKEITLPLIRSACFAGMAYVFVRCMTAVSAVIFLVSARWNHMTVLILAETEILRFSAAAVLCLILIAIVLGVFALLSKILKMDLVEGVT